MDPTRRDATQEAHHDTRYDFERPAPLKEIVMHDDQKTDPLLVLADDGNPLASDD